MKAVSLRFLLLRRLLSATALLLLAGAATAYWVAWRSATKAYDRALFDTTLAIAEQLRVVDGKPQLPLTPQARTVLLVDKFDSIFYAVRGPGSQLLDGDEGLSMLPDSELDDGGGEGRYYFDSTLRGRPIRIAALRKDLAGQTVTVLAGETLIKRNALVQEILLGMWLPELLLSAVSIVVVLVGIRSSLRPLAELRQELAERSHTDLRPVRVDVPEEIQPVVTEINGLLRRLESSLDAQRHFVADAAHQLRTPLAALQAQVEAALGESANSGRLALEGILTATHRLSHLVGQMLALARAEPSLDETREHVSLSALIRETAESWLPGAFERHVDLGFELSPAVVRGNALLLQELLANLLDNALRHVPDGGTVTVGCGQEGKQAWLAVEDSGPGIAENDWERVFERFYRPAGSLNDGTGLGLAIVREIARQHGGTVRASNSQRLGGARLLVQLPAVDEPAAKLE